MPDLTTDGLARLRAIAEESETFTSEELERQGLVGVYAPAEEEPRARR